MPLRQTSRIPKIQSPGGATLTGQILIVSRQLHTNILGC